MAGGHDVHGSPLAPPKLARCVPLWGWTWRRSRCRALARVLGRAASAVLRCRPIGRPLGRLPQRAPGAGGRVPAPDGPVTCCEFRRRRGAGPGSGWPAAPVPVATRKASSWRSTHWLGAARICSGGSADLTGEPHQFQGCTLAVVTARATPELGVREFGMAAAFNGMALHGGFIFLTGHLPDTSATTAATHPHGGACVEAARDPCLHAPTASAG